jgi:hypothetical protein
MVAISTPIRLPGIAGFPGSFASDLAASFREEVLAEIDAVVLTLQSRVERIEMDGQHALEKARRLRRLGGVADLTQPISVMRGILADCETAVADWDSVNLPRLDSDRHGPAQGLIRDVIRTVGSELASVRDRVRALLGDLEAEQSAPMPSEDTTPIARGLEAYRDALTSALAAFSVGEIAAGVIEAGGEIVPVLEVQLGVVDDQAAVIEREQIAHAEVAALDPSLVGLFAIEYVRSDAAA